MSQDLMLIGAFAARSRLSPKALRLYDELGLLVPVEVDRATGYRFYAEDQLDRARLIALLRHLDLPLARIREVLALPPTAATAAVRDWWAGRERELATARPVVVYVSALLQGEIPMTKSYEVQVRQIPERAVVGGVRHVHAAEAGGVLGAVLGSLARSGAGLSGIEGCPYLVFYGAVSGDSDGPVEVVRPFADTETAQGAAARVSEAQARVEPRHDEAFVRLTMAETGWPAMLPALDALEAHLAATGRSPAGPPRQVMIADWRTARTDDLACDLTLPLTAP